MSKASCVGQCFPYILCFKIREVGNQIRDTATGRYCLDDHAHGHAHAADARLAAHDSWVHSDSPEILHAAMIPQIDTGGVAGTQGFEPRYAAPEAAVLPLDDVPPTEFSLPKFQPPNPPDPA